MHQIALITRSELSKFDKYEEIMRDAHVKIQVFAPDSITEETLMEMDSFVFVDLGKALLENCESMVFVRSKTAKPMWVITRNVTKNIRKAYTQLGAIDLTKIVEDFEELVIFFENVCQFNQLHEPSFAEANQGVKTILEPSMILATEQESFLLNRQNQSLLVDGKEIFLTKKEFLVLDLLVKKRGVVVTCQDFSEEIFSSQYSTKKVKYRLSNIISLIRKKLEGNQVSANLLNIKVVSGEGYILRCEN